MGGISILDRYIGANVVAGVLLALLVLLGLFTLFEFVDELEHLGRGEYSLGPILLYVTLRVPRLTYELFPIAALVGALLGLGMLARNGELTVMRCAGLSRRDIAMSVMKSGLIFVVCSMCLGEFLSPYAEQYGTNYRSMKRNSTVSLRTRGGLWARDGDSYINIRQVLPGNTLRDIYIHEFDAAARLRTTTHAREARYEANRWILEEIVQTQFGDRQLIRKQLSRAAWSSLLNPELIQVVTFNPDMLSIWSLTKYIDYLRANSLDARRYEHALWAKVMYPVATGVMVFLAIPVVMINLTRTSGPGARVLLGTGIGLAFHILNQATGNLAVVANLPPVLSASGPTLIVLTIAMLLLRRSA